MSPQEYKELFLLDEASTPAAGHRPCAACRRAEDDTSKKLWMKANPELAARSEGKTPEIDKLLNAERVDAQRNNRMCSARPAPLPDACMVMLPVARDARLLWGGAVHAWTPAGTRPERHLRPIPQ